MVLSAKLDLRQSQSLVMTPQLQQAIKLLQLSNLELCAFVETELERNPLLERDESENVAEASDTGPAERLADGDATAADEFLNAGLASEDPASSLDTEYQNIDPDASAGDFAQPAISTASFVSGPAGDGDANLEAYVAADISLHDHLRAQLNLSVSQPSERLIGAHLIDQVDEAGYFRGDTETIATQLGTSVDLVDHVLELLQGFEPTGVFARDLAECLALQLKERNRYDPVIACVLDNLALLANHDLAGLKRICRLSSDELTDIIAEIKSLSPKPGLAFGSVPLQPIVPDVSVRMRSDGSWLVELNAETLPKVLVNRSYYTTVVKNSRRSTDKEYLQECLQTANWLTKSLDQRARTILRVAEEIVRQQDAFFTYGVQYLKPLNLRTVADAISMHESTVSRVTSNKYVATARGIFELKYFFTSAIASSGAGEAHSSEAVRHRIRQLVDAETADTVLSDDKIVAKLRKDGIDIARRTVAKYREAMHIASSVQRRRQKKLAERTGESASCQRAMAM